MKKGLFFSVFALFILMNGACSSKGRGSMDSIKGKEGVFAIISTSKGDIAIELYYKDTPLTVTNFVGLAEGTLDAAHGKPFYNGLKFHRVIENFMIQGGDPRGNGTGGPGYKFVDEIVDKYVFDGAGILAMANAGANTNGSLLCRADSASSLRCFSSLRTYRLLPAWLPRVNDAASSASNSAISRRMTSRRALPVVQ